MDFWRDTPLRASSVLGRKEHFALQEMCGCVRHTSFDEIAQIGVNRKRVLYVVAQIACNGLDELGRGDAFDIEERGAGGCQHTGGCRIGAALLAIECAATP